MAPERPVNRYAPSMPLHKVRRRRRTYASNVPIFGIVAVSCSAVLAATHAAAYLTTSSTARHVFTSSLGVATAVADPVLDDADAPADAPSGQHIIAVLARDGSIARHTVGMYLSGRNVFIVPAASIRDAGGAQTNTPNHDEPAMLELVALHDDTDVAVLRFTHDELNEDLEESAGGSLGTRQPDAGASLVLVYRDMNGEIATAPVVLASYDNQMDVAAATGRLPRGSHGTWMKLTSDTNPADSAGSIIDLRTGAVVGMVSTPLIAADGAGWYARPPTDTAVTLQNTALGEVGWVGARRGGVQNLGRPQPAQVQQPRAVRFTSIIQQSRIFANRVMCNRCNGTGEYRSDICSLCSGRCVHNDQRRFTDYLTRFITDCADSEPWSQQRGSNVVTVVDNIRSAFTSCLVARDRTINQRADKCLAAPGACPESPVWFIAFADGTEVAPDGSLVVLGQVLHSGHRVALVSTQYADPKVNDLFFGAGMIDGMYSMQSRPHIRVRNGFAIQLPFEPNRCDPPIRRVHPPR